MLGISSQWTLDRSTCTTILYTFAPASRALGNVAAATPTTLAAQAQNLADPQTLRPQRRRGHEDQRLRLLPRLSICKSLKAIDHPERTTLSLAAWSL